MPVAVQGAASVNSVNAATGITFSHTVGAGADLGLVVAVACTGLAHGGGSANVSAVSFDGVALTALGSRGFAADAVRTSLWLLKDAAIHRVTGSVVVSLGVVVSDIVASAITVTGMHQTTSTGVYASAAGANNAPGVGVAAAVDDLVVDIVGVDAAGVETATVNASQTQRFNQMNGDGHLIGAGSTKAGAAPTVNMLWTLTTNLLWTQSAVAIKPAPAVVADLTWMRHRR